MRSFWVTLVGLLAMSCQPNSKNSYLPASNGSINSVAVVIDNELWKGDVGDAVRDYFAAPQEGLPQEEPLFFLHQIPPSVFKDNMRNSRNILMLIKKENAPISCNVRDTLFAKPQKVAVITGQTDTQLKDELRQNAEKIIATFKANEIEEAQKRFRNSLSSDTTLSQKFGISMLLPSVYKVVSNKDNFLWIERPVKGGNANLFVYAIPYGRIPDTEDRVQSIIKVRDSIGKLFVPGREVPGRAEPTYMITQDLFTPSVYDTEVSGRKAIETRGLWAIDGVALGGPFVNYIIEDRPNNRLLVIDGVVLANMVPKRDYIFEIEAIVRSLKFNKL